VKILSSRFCLCYHGFSYKPKGGRSSSLSLSEVMAILMLQKEYCIDNKKAL